MKRHQTRLIAAIATGALAMTRIASATIQLTTAGYTNDFSNDFWSIQWAGDWMTSTSNIAGTDTRFIDVASIDTFVVTNNYNASGLTTALGTSATDPPSANVVARRNTTRQFVQMRPPSGGKAATVPRGPPAKCDRWHRSVVGRLLQFFQPRHRRRSRGGSRLAGLLQHHGRLNWMRPRSPTNSTRSAN